MRINIFIFLIAFVLVGCNPFKVTDPSDPRFDPDKFSFSDYEWPEKDAVFRKLFPIGTDKKFVDRVLVQAGQAKSYPLQNSTTVWLYIPPETGLVKGVGNAAYTIRYDNKSKVLSIKGPPNFKNILITEDN